MVTMVISVEPGGLGLVGLMARTGPGQQAVGRVVAELRKRGYVDLQAHDYDAHRRKFGANRARHCVSSADR